MSDKSNFKIKIGRQHGDDGPTVTINLNINFDKDAPPALAKAIFEGLGKLIVAGTDEETVLKVKAEMEELAQSRQREIDHSARMLLGEGEPEP